MEQKNNPLHGITLETIITQLVDSIGWDALGDAVPVKCLRSDPSISSSLKFFRKTPWARTKLESFYLYALRKGMIKS